MQEFVEYLVSNKKKSLVRYQKRLIDSFRDHLRNREEASKVKTEEEERLEKERIEELRKQIEDPLIHISKPEKSDPYESIEEQDFISPEIVKTNLVTAQQKKWNITLEVKRFDTQVHYSSCVALFDNSGSEGLIGIDLTQASDNVGLLYFKKKSSGTFKKTLYSGSSFYDLIHF